ncbi:MAG: hypothetical protein V3U03_06240 [Myxococcota bacterium]
MTTRAVAWAGLAAAFGALLASFSATAQGVEPTWYAQAIARGDMGLNITEFWSKGAKMRAETVVAGHKVVTIVNGDTYYAYDSLTKRGVAIGRAPAAIAADDPQRRPFGKEAQVLLRQGAEKVREEVFLGRPCDVYRVTDRRGRREIWVTRDAKQLPLRIQVYVRSRHRNQNTDYVNWLSGLSISDRFFEPEAGIELDRIGFAEYVVRASTDLVGPVPVLYADLLRGKRGEYPLDLPGIGDDAAD